MRRATNDDDEDAKKSLWPKQVLSIRRPTHIHSICRRKQSRERERERELLRAICTNAYAQNLFPFLAPLCIFSLMTQPHVRPILTFTRDRNAIFSGPRGRSTPARPTGRGLESDNNSTMADPDVASSNVHSTAQHTWKSENASLFCLRRRAFSGQQCHTCARQRSVYTYTYIAMVKSVFHVCEFV